MKWNRWIPVCVRLRKKEVEKNFPLVCFKVSYLYTSRSLKHQINDQHNCYINRAMKFTSLLAFFSPNNRRLFVSFDALDVNIFLLGDTHNTFAFDRQRWDKMNVTFPLIDEFSFFRSLARSFVDSNCFSILLTNEESLNNVGISSIVSMLHVLIYADVCARTFLR